MWQWPCMIYLQIAILWHVGRYTKCYFSTFYEPLVRHAWTNMKISPEVHLHPWSQIPTSSILLSPPSQPPRPYSFWDTTVWLVIDTDTGKIISIMYFSCASFVAMFGVLVTVTAHMCLSLTFSHIPLTNYDTFVVMTVAATSCMASVEYSRAHRPRPTLSIDVSLHTNREIVEVNTIPIKSNKQQ